MSILFREYELLANSGLFDPAYYLQTNPDVANGNEDPLLHYLERGGTEHRDPSAQFDTAHYLTQCFALGELPANPLLHYLTVGADRGFTLRADASNAVYRPSMLAAQQAKQDTVNDDEYESTHEDAAPLALFVDVPRIVNGAAEAPVCGGLTIVGWGFAASGVESIDVLVDGKRLTTARYGLRRPDVAAANPTWRDAMHSGYNAHVPTKALTHGTHRVAVSLRTRDGRAKHTEFSIEVREAPDGSSSKALRRKMSHAEALYQLDVLARLNWQPRFTLLLPWRASASEKTEQIEKTRALVENLSRQVYSNWQLCLIDTNDRDGKSIALRSVPRALTTGFDDLKAKICLMSMATLRTDDQLHFVWRVAAGDELGCDALLEFALGSAFARDADLIYCDERCMDGEGRMATFYKPHWSPDLLLSTNYFGRAWCAELGLIRRAGLSMTAFAQLETYDAALRLSEHATRIEHICKLLNASQPPESEDTKEQRSAISAALARRGITGEVQAGRSPGHYRVKRHAPAARISIVIHASGDEHALKSCIESIRTHTAYADYEIICVGNISAAHEHWKPSACPDTVIATATIRSERQALHAAVARSNGKYLLFLSEAARITEPTWLSALLEHAQRPEVGAVGPLLLYPDRSVQHAGIFIDVSGRQHHAFRHLPEGDPGYFGLALTQRNVIAVSGACLMTRRETFDALGGFNTDVIASAGMDATAIDYCLRAWRKGLLNVYTPYARLVYPHIGGDLLGTQSHRNGGNDATTSSIEFHDTLGISGDPYFNCNLSSDHDEFTVEPEPVRLVYPGHPRFDRAAIRRILVVKLDHIGDCITAIPAIKRLRYHFPEAHIAVLAGKATRPIWNSVPAVNEFLEFNFFNAQSSLGKLSLDATQWQGLRKRLREARFDLAIDLRKQPDTREVLPFTESRVLAGFDHQGKFPWLDVALEWDEDVPLRAKHGHVSDDLVSLIEALATHGTAVRDSTLSLPPASTHLPFLSSSQQRMLSKPVVCIHPAAGNPMRHWPSTHFAELIERLLASCDVHVALIGTRDEAAVALQVQKNLQHHRRVFDLMGQVSLEQLPALLAHTALFVGNNSGPQHLAAAYGVPTVCIQGGVIDANEWGPAGPAALAIRRDMTCSPCFIERANNCPRALACLTQLPPVSVAQLCMQILQSQVRQALPVRASRTRASSSC